MTGGGDLVEVGDRVYVLRRERLDVNSTLIVGGTAAVIVDTGSTPAEAAALVTAARRVTALPWSVVNTHHHFDHCFGNQVVAGDPPAPVWAHQEAARLLHRPVEVVRDEAYREMADDDPQFAARLRDVVVRPPDRTVTRSVTLDLGDRAVELWHPGRGHTIGDLVVLVPDADLLVAGDLVEQGAPPSFDDGYPLEWPDTLAAVSRRLGPSSVVVPGHGACVDTGFVRAQHAELVALEWLIRDGHADGAPVDRVATQAPFGVATATVAVTRGYAELANRV
ncbi:MULTISPECIES: MBL fold metallo-hydrolase [unclassified Solwaraspora]|uniref:MBL fold metallo-hydrolase n=1 Tax=unclassified Solwaraspora TaxID=2627926 RepID=UPI00259B2710|nr:MBL fold metallo-hydrolase [Solwaraspora sp. WMMA2056]WJK38363.1 MBL fold metallo-hydrolase [Solwaraspora sp. WMMA2056]